MTSVSAKRTTNPQADKCGRENRYESKGISQNRVGVLVRHPGDTWLGVCAGPRLRMRAAKKFRADSRDGHQKIREPIEIPVSVITSKGKAEADVNSA